MAVVAFDALPFGHRIVLNLVPANLGLGVGMAGEAERTGLAIKEFGLICAVRAVAGEAVALGKGRMGGICFLGGDQIFMAGQTEFPLIRRNFEQARFISAMGIVAARACPPGKGFMNTEQSLLRPGLSVAGETEI